MQDSTARFKKITKIGGKTRWSQDLYHFLLIIGWTRFFFLFVGIFFVFNLFFGFLYWMSPGALSGTNGTYWHDFLFSVQTYTTVGYGTFSPSSDVAHIIVIIESMTAIFLSALLTGLMFAKFSRPSARILFSNAVLINNFDGKRTMMLRMGNLRANQIAEAQVRVVLLQSHQTKEGQTIRRQVDLKVLRSSSLFFALSWLVIHEIENDSPLYNLTSQDLIEQNIEIAVSVIGNDSTFNQTVHAGCIYGPQEVIFDRYFEDVIESENGKIRAINYKKFHDLRNA